MTMDDQKEYVLQSCRDHDIKFIRLWFTDILGFLKSFAITVEELEQALDEGQGFDGSSIEGFARVDESDMIAMPDPATFQILPWRPKERGVARMFCDIQHPDGTPFDGDPRFVLKRQLKRASDLGYTFYVGPELEFFYFKSSEPPVIGLDKGGYFDLTPLDVASDLRRETIMILEEMGIGVEYSHHEVAPSQHEIDLRYTDALTMADARDDVPARREGGGAGERRLRDLHAEAALGRERQRHAHAPVAVQGRPQRLLRRERRVPPVADREVVHGGHAAARAGVHAGHEPVGEQLQAARAGIRGAGRTSRGRGATAATSSACRSTSPARKSRRGSSTARRTRRAIRTSRSR